jgi:hypothetical protein
MMALHSDATVEGQLRSRFRARAPASSSRAQSSPNIAEALEGLEALLRRVIWLPNDRDYAVLPIWALYTHAFAKFMHAPRLALHSPVPGCGKTTLFWILEAVIRLGKIWGNPTPAVLFRRMDAEHPTLLFDEADKYLYADNRDVLMILNAGHAFKGACVPRCIDDGEGDYLVKEFNVFGPVAFALKGMELAADLAERSIRINMRKSTKQMELFAPALDKQLWAWRDVFGKWAKEAKLPAVDMPAAVKNRGADNWRPLLTVAKAAGGDWYERISAAADAYEQKQESTDRNMMLLRHTNIIWPRAQKFMGSVAMVSKLMAEEQWPWGEYNRGQGLTTHALAKKLKLFDVVPEQIKLTTLEQPQHPEQKSGWLRGYRRADLERAWAEYGIVD